MSTSTLSKPVRGASAELPPVHREIVTLCKELKSHMTGAVDRALRIGLHLLVIHRESQGEQGGFKAALESIEQFEIPRSTAYRWINASGRFLANHQNIADENGDFDEADLVIPEPGSQAFAETEKAMAAYAATSSMRRLMLGSAANSEESRMDALISASEQGDTLADEILDRIAKGELTLVQAIRARAGAAATKGKNRKDPVYLDIDGTTGEPKGLFVKSLITLSNTFDHWNELDETARQKAKASWKALVAKIPKELR